MKAYIINAMKDQLFAIYNRDGIATLVNDHENPWVGCSQIWDKNTKQYKSVWTAMSKIQGSIWTDSDKIIFPAYCVKENEFQNWVKHEIKPLLETLMNVWGDPKEFNVFLFKKKAGKLPGPLAGTIEVSLGGLKSDIRGKRCNSKLTLYCNRLLNQKIFW